MLRYFLLSRLLRVFIVFFIIVLLNFLLPRAMPGDPASILANEYNLPADTVRILRSMWKLDRPLYEQFFAYLESLFTGQWGYSYKYYPRTVYELVMERLPWTLLLQGITSLTVSGLGIIMGILAGWRRGSKVDVSITVSAIVVYAIPYYWLALMLQYVFGYMLKVFPVAHAVTPGLPHANFFEYALDILWHLALPVTAVTLTAYASYTLVTRNSMVDVLEEDFIFVAKAKGLPERVVMKHAIRNALLPPLTMLAIRLGHIVGGAVITETVFSYPGVGYLIYESIIYKDYPVLNAAFFMLAITVIAANFAADLLYAVVDPRIRYVKRG
ncbi:MAG: ABC transporter permease [Sulfolobales archaeon]